MPGARKVYPDFLTHYFSDEPFRSIMDLSAAEQVRLVLRMRGRGQVPRRLMIPRYYESRRRYEAAMRRQFIEKGGRPTLRSPCYLILGESELWSRRAARSVRIPLSAVPPDAISVTYTDSWYAYNDAELNGCPIPRQPQYGMVYRPEELESLFTRYGWPGERWKNWRNDPAHRFDYYVEAQVWSQAPLREYLSQYAA